MRTSSNFVTLRPFELADAETHLQGEDEEQIKWLSGGKGTLEGVKKWILKNQDYWKKGGPIFNFAIENNYQKLVGMIEANSDYKNIEGLEKGDVNISYGIYPNFRGKGYATSAMILMLNFLKVKNFKRAVLRINPANKDSLKIPEKFGFEEKETMVSKEGENLRLFIKNLN